MDKEFIESPVEAYEKLKQEYEQYKKSKQVSYEQLQKRCNELELGIRKLQKQFGIEILYCKATGESTFRSTEILKLKRTLTEIKEIAEVQQSWNEVNRQISETEFEDDIFAWNWSALKQILNKISEVIKDEEV